MTADRLAALRTFFVKIEPRLPEVVALMYDLFFEAEPSAARLFKGELGEQKQRFVHELQSIVRLTRSSELWPADAATGQILIPEVAEFGRRHAAAGVTLHHFEVMKKAMEQACEKIVPNEITLEVAEALSYLFEVLAHSLSTPADSAVSVLAMLRPAAREGTLHDPSAYFDDVPPTVSAG